MAKNEGKKFEEDFKQSCEKVDSEQILKLISPIPVSVNHF